MQIEDKELEDLAKLCRYSQSKEHFEEATKCYSAGAYRSCIVATWLAVVYDFIYKINVLHLEGETSVDKIVKTISDSQQEGAAGIDASQRLEKSLISDSVTLELVSQVESTFLKRLQLDRHLCAHPSMQTLNEPFQASAELARVHLKSAVEYFLQNPPVQGKAALERVQADIDSEGFPNTMEGAINYFKTGRMSHARPALVRNLVVTLTKSVLLDPENGNRKARQYAALGAISVIYPESAEKGVSDSLTSTISRISDCDLHQVFAYVRFVPNSWTLMDEWVRIKLTTFVEEGELKAVTRSLLHASRIDLLADKAKERLSMVSPEEIMEFEELQSIPENIEKIVERFIDSPSYDSAKLNGRNLVRLREFLSLSQYQRIILSYAQNSQVNGCFQTVGYLDLILRASEKDKDELREICRSVYDSSNYQDGIDRVLVSHFPEFLKTPKKSQFPDVDDDELVEETF